MTDLSDLPPLERAKRCRELAARARREAQSTEGRIRDGYLMIETGWLTLAADIEVSASHSGDDGQDVKQAALRVPQSSKADTEDE